jgi:hypothetical protein
MNIEVAIVSTVDAIQSQPQDIRSVNSTCLLAILVIGIFIIGLLGGLTKGGE